MSSDKAAAAESTETPLTSTDQNSRTELIVRVRTGKLTWSGPLLVLAGRSALMIPAQALAACVLWLHNHSWSWNAAAKWWSVYGTLVDLGCLALMRLYVRNEGICLRDLIGPIRLRWGRDLFLGVGCLLLIFPVFALAFPAASWLVYGSSRPEMYPGLLGARTLPLWGVFYSLSLFLILWSPTEEMTYNGYTLPRLEALSGNRWGALAIVGFWWALQHSFIPFILDWRYVEWRFIAFLPGVLAFSLIYMPLRRLPPLIVAHWAMDTSAILYTLQF